MPISEAARADLYTGLVEVLGLDRAETLMAHLSNFDPADVATKSDVAAVKTDVAALKTDVAALKTDVADLKTKVAELRLELKSEIAVVRDGLAAVNQRLDRLFQTLLLGMFGVAAALVGLAFRIG